MDIDALLSSIAIYALPVIFAITLHEAAHGYVAKMLGDRTAYLMGRVSLNPLRHIDPIGTVLIPLLTLLFSPIMFGWAKPVPVDYRHLRHPKRDMMWVALAGPGANLAMILAWGLVLKLALVLPMGAFAEPMRLMGAKGVQVNAVLMLLNLVPILPLDGGRVLVGLLPYPLASRYAMLEPYGFFILLALIYFRVLWVVLAPLFALIAMALSSLLGVPPDVLLL